MQLDSTRTVTSFNIQPYEMNNADDIDALARHLIREKWDGKDKNGFDINGMCFEGYGTTFFVHDFNTIQKRVLELRNNPQVQVNSSSVKIFSSNKVPSNPITSRYSPSNLEIKNINIYNFLNFLEVGLHKVKKAKRLKSSVIVGKTGAGKSTLLNVLATDPKYKYEPSFLGNVLVAKGEELAPTSDEVTSKTSIIKVYQCKDNKNLAFADSPGFLDNSCKEKQMAMDIAFCEMFKERKHLKSLIVAIDANDFGEAKLINLSLTAQRLDEIIRRPKEMQNCLTFVITKKDNRANTQAFESIDAFIKCTTDLVEKAVKAKNLSLAQILCLMTKENTFLADFTEDKGKKLKENLLSRIEKQIQKIPENAIHSELMGERRRDVRLFVNACFREILQVQKKENTIKSSIEILKKIIVASDAIKDANEKRKAELEKQEFVFTDFTEDYRTSGLCLQLEKNISDLDSQIQNIQENINNLETNIKLFNFSYRLYFNGVQIRCLNAIETELTKKVKKYNLLNTSERVVLWEESIQEKRSFLFGFLGRTVHFFNYQGKPYKKAYPHYPDNEAHKFTADPQNTKQGVYKAVYSTSLNTDGNCTVEIKGEKKVKYREKLSALTDEIKKITTEKSQRVAQIQVFQNQLDNWKQQLNARLEEKKSKEEEIKNLKYNDKAEYDKLQAEAKLAFDKRKNNELDQLNISIKETNKRSIKAAKQLNTQTDQLTEHIQTIANQAILHDPETINLLKEVYNIAGIKHSKALKEYEAFLSKPQGNPEFYCSSDKDTFMTDPYSHLLRNEKTSKICRANFEKTKILGIIEKDPLYCCTECRSVIKIEDLKPNVELKNRINTFLKQLNPKEKNSESLSS